MSAPGSVWKKYAADIVVIFLGAALMAVSVNVFLEPYHILSGGVTGLAMVINYLFNGLPIGMLVLAINIPLFALAFWRIGPEFLISSLYGTVVYSVLIDLLGPYLPSVEVEPLLAAIIGGALMGLGLALVFIRGATTGGSDVAARLLKLAAPHIQMGQMILLIDAVIIVLAGAVEQSIRSALYAAINIYVGTAVIDKILYGANYARVAYVISDENVRIAREITTKLDRGVTFLNGQGAYSNREKKVLLCVIKRHQISALKRLVKEIDPKAFVILSEASEVLGEGFGAYNKNSL